MDAIFADWNYADREGRLYLDLPRSRKDLGALGELSDGMSVVLNVEDDFLVDATLVFDGSWRAIPDKSTIRYPFKSEPDPRTLVPLKEVRRIEAYIRFRTHEEGGRTQPVRSGYRAKVDFGVRDQKTGQAVLHDCLLNLLDCKIVFPGQSALVELKPRRPELLEGVVREAQVIEVWEDGVIAHGRTVATLAGVQRLQEL